MKLSADRVKSLCRRKHITVKRLLDEAGVSRNAYYTLARKETVLPKSILAIGNFLSVRSSRLLEEESPVTRQAKQLVAEVEHVMKRHDSVDRDNIRHTLLLLRREPVNRLRSALLRGQKPDIR